VQLGDVSDIDDRHAAVRDEGKTTPEDLDGEAAALAEVGIVRPPDHARIGDGDGSTGVLVAARDPIRVCLRAGVGATGCPEGRLGCQLPAVRREQSDVARDVDDRVETEPLRRREDEISPARVRLLHQLRVASAERIDRGGVEDSLASLHRPFDADGIGDVSLDRVDLVHTDRLESRSDPLRGAHKQPHLVPRTHERGHAVRAHEASPTSHEHPHPHHLSIAAALFSHQASNARSTRDDLGGREDAESFIDSFKTELIRDRV
jgi:hypothetical protein